MTGFLGSGKTTLIRRLLSQPDMRDTMVIVNEFGEIGLDHHLIQAVTDNVILLSNGCMCCRVRQDVVQTLRELHHGWLSGAIPAFGRVVVETTGLAEPGPLVASLTGHPLLADAFALRSITTVVDAEYGLDHLAQGATSRNQICVADHLFISKSDLVEPARIPAIRRRLNILNPIAKILTEDCIRAPGSLFQRSSRLSLGSRFLCEDSDDHLTGISTLLLRVTAPLGWTRFRLWLNDVLNDHGARLLRLKGCLSFDASIEPVIIQAVHHSFYPIEPARLVDDVFLILIFEGPVPVDIEASFDLMRLSVPIRDRDDKNTVTERR